MTLEAKLALASASSDPEILAELASQSLDEGEEEQALPLLERALRQHPTARLWQWLGLLERSLDWHERALASFAEAVRLDPSDVSIARGQARIALEAGLDARDLYERALALAPGDGALLLGLAAARAARGEGARAADDLAAVLERAPAWTYGHEQLAQLLSTLGRRDEATASLERALKRFPHAAQLWETLLALEVRREAYSSLPEILGRARAAGVRAPGFATYEAIYAAQFDEATRPEALFGQAAQGRPELDVWRLRHLLRTGSIAEAVSLIDEQLAGQPSGDIWAYAATAWRQAGDRRSEWLEGDPTVVVAVLDIKDTLPPLYKLGVTLRELHVAKGEYLDQSVRGGTQTDGPLLSRIDPTIQNLRKSLVDAVEAYVSQLPPMDPRHPLLRHRRDRRIRFAGSWSVRLRPGGRHSHHIHPQGWISSALYISLPAGMADESANAGWFTLGQPDETLALDLSPRLKVEPVEGRLVLFPSWMWHGTVPFAHGERLSVAFDMAPPR